MKRLFFGIAAIMLVMVMLSCNVFFVVAANTVDKTAPNITGVSISSPSSIVTSGNKISFDVIVEDESGVQTLFLAFRPVDPGNGSANVQRTLRAFSYDDSTHTATLELLVSDSMPDGEWYLAWIFVEDTRGNTKNYYYDSVPGFNETVFTVTGNAADFDAPNITGVSINSPSSIVAPGSKISFDVIVEDESGIQTLFLAFRPVDSGDGDIQRTIRDFSYDDSTHTATLELLVSETTPDGEWYLAWIFVEDSYGNTKNYYDSVPGFDELRFTVAAEPVHVHSLKQVAARAAGCDEIGWQAYEYCTGCDYSTYVQLPPLGHDYVSVVTTEPTCTEKGEQTYTCKNDSSHVYTQPIAEKGHDYGEYVVDVEPTPIEPGRKSRHCSRCDSTTDAQSIPATGGGPHLGFSYINKKQELTAQQAAFELYEMGLLKGTGTDSVGTPVFELGREPDRFEAVTMLVRLLGKEEQALAGDWTTPFTDMPDWAKPYVGYAYQNGLTYGVSETMYGSGSISATQYITFVLRALGYESGVDFRWDTAWELSDELGITNGEYHAHSVFTRGDMALISYRAIQQVSLN